MQPIDPEKAPKVHIPALNHIGLWVDDIRLAVDDLTSNGIKFAPGGIRKGACKNSYLYYCKYTLLFSKFYLIAGYDVTFIHPKSAGGVLVELVQAPDDVIAANK